LCFSGKKTKNVRISSSYYRKMLEEELPDTYPSLCGIIYLSRLLDPNSLISEATHVRHLGVRYGVVATSLSYDVLAAAETSSLSRKQASTCNLVMHNPSKKESRYITNYRFRHYIMPRSEKSMDLGDNQFSD
jgi:hypothetical protein